MTSSAPIRIAVLGAGYLGAVHSAAMAQLGHRTVGVDIDADKVEALQRGDAPFFEPGLTELLRQGIDAGTLQFSTDLDAVRDVDVVFVAVGTPQAEGSDAADMGAINAVFAALTSRVRPGTLVVGKSTVPVGTAARLAPALDEVGAQLMWNPEFLREGYAVRDALEPDRLVYGARDGDEGALERLDAVYQQLLDRGIPRFVTDLATAELVKASANAFLATKISFINAMAEIAEVAGADVTQLADAIGVDVRIGRKFLNSGIGFGGGCLPKDIRAFRARAEELGAGDAVAFLGEVDAINLRRRARMVTLIREARERAGGGRVGLLGLAFKPESDDVRDSPALDIAARLLDEGIPVRAYDPQAQYSAAARLPSLDITTTVAEAIGGASVLALATEWREFRDLDPHWVAEHTAAREIVDGRNVLDRTAWTAAGFRVVSPGRRDALPNSDVRASTDARSNDGGHA